MSWVTDAYKGVADWFSNMGPVGKTATTAGTATAAIATAVLGSWALRSCGSSGLPQGMYDIADVKYKRRICSRHPDCEIPERLFFDLRKGSEDVRPDVTVPVDNLPSGLPEKERERYKAAGSIELRGRAMDKYTHPSTGKTYYTYPLHQLVIPKED